MMHYKKLLYITLTFSLCSHLAAMDPALFGSYAANAKANSEELFAELKKYKQCNTPWNTKEEAKQEYRELVFEAATALGHPHPEKIMLHNDKNDRAAAGTCIIKGDIGRGIYINQDELDKETIGSRRITIFHEVAHLVKRHISLQKDMEEKFIDQAMKNHPQEAAKIKQGLIDAQTRALIEKYKQEFQAQLLDFKLKNEYEADRMAAHGASCEVCARAKGDFFLNRCGQNDKLIAIKIKMDFNELTKLINQCKGDTLAYCKESGDCHPSHIERALRFYRYALVDDIKGKFCKYHAKERREHEEFAKQFPQAAAAHQPQQHVLPLPVTPKLSLNAMRRMLKRIEDEIQSIGAPKNALKRAELIKLQKEKADLERKLQKEQAKEQVPGVPVPAIKPALTKPVPAAAKPAMAPAAAAQQPLAQNQDRKMAAELFTHEQLNTIMYKGLPVSRLLNKTIQDGDAWDFEKTNTFKRGEVIAILRSTGNWTYGVVLYHNDQGVTVQVTLDTIRENQAPEIIGKHRK